MKKLKLIAAIMVAQLSLAQQSVIFYDDLFKEAISNVQIYNAQGKFIGLSNEKGVFETTDKKLPFELKKSGFHITKMYDFKDTVLMNPKFQQISEVEIKPVVKMDLYNAIIENSSGQVSRKTENQFGVYFQSLLMIDTKNNDTVRMEMICDFGLSKIGSKKKIDYSMFCENGKKNYSFSGSGNGELASASSDTSSLGKMLNVLPSFEKNFDYDLMKTKSYNLNFDESQIKRELGVERHRLMFKNNKNTMNTVVVGYRDSILYSWTNSLSQFKEYDGKGIFINFKKMNRQVEFNESENYCFSSIIENATIEIGLSGVLYEIHVVKGFIEDPSRSFEMKTAEKKVEDYFKELPNIGEVNSFYNFELEK